jgi:PAS domain S-box-containing protein
MEQALRASEVSYRRLFEAARDGILILDATTGRIQDVNAFLIELLGIPRDEMIGKTVAEICPFKDDHLNKAMFERLRSERYVRYEDLPLQSSDGREIAVEFVSNVYQAGEFEVIQCNIRDITQRKAAEAALRESVERYRTLFELAPVAVYYCDASGVIGEFNRRAEELWGCRPAPGDTNERFCGAFKLLRPDGSLMPYEECPMAEVLRGDLPAAQNMEMIIERPDRSRITVMVAIRPLKDHQGSITGAVNCFYNITERKRGEQELRSSREQLRALAARIQEAREEERTHAAREIHDVLAQELTGLKMEVAWLSRRLAEPMADWKRNVLREKVGVVMDLASKASKSVQRIAAELRPAVLDSLGLCAAIEWVAGDFQKRTEIHCRASVPAKDVAMEDARSTALFRILQESLTNVARHAKAAKVKIRLRLVAGDVILTVDDDGRGIRPGELTNARSMGLMGMRERASLLDGKCTIALRDLGGTSVEVRIPATKIMQRIIST